MNKEKLDALNAELSEVLKKYNATLQVGHVINVVELPEVQEVTGTPEPENQEVDGTSESAK